ncbi:nicotinate-nucleotide--dimethylbenzimidazole phosphoribosyltransferase [Pseudoalteromonas sp. S16_S37]|uniref:nicotinate-nucleotide--dimethylbenzimidazole phosphoribosyltransferase n=1 Tax=Pseudoalteromonas sp. S16_S37 TaxID=2720228 RepID=UPI00167FE39D|nr:nicotinate-nucleotide--dimethylbenzimidazole phosphoribosyltransferase [Pseudoalteromonas sp. S16_S37]MBD1580836.1 nicotinate-nucleotide--dimethylbenzimidazole phosphoribosyltransferase [Pseudoalteromonas sp. S16_S37]
MMVIPPLNRQFEQQIQHKIDLKTKPLGALGQLEELAKQLVLILSQSLTEQQLETAEFKLIAPQLVVFAGDHGIAQQGISIAPSEVTGQMVANFATGGAAINVFCRQLGWQLSVVDCGILTPPASELKVISQRLGSTTRCFVKEEALSQTQLEQGLQYGKQLIAKLAQQGSNVFAFGEMGIGNTSAAAAILSALTGLPAKETVGSGTGVSEDIRSKKQRLIELALVHHQGRFHNAYDILRCFGGFEICQMVGAILEAAKLQRMIVIDGFIASAAAMLAINICDACKDYMIFAHCSGEQGHQKMLSELNVTPLLNLGLRLGEGTGAALCLPLMQSALAFYNEMASFEQAQVTHVVPCE